MKYLFCIAALFLLEWDIAEAAETSLPESITIAQSGERKTRKRKRMRPDIKAPGDIDMQNPEAMKGEARDAIEKKLADKVKSAFFPDWKPLGFSWGVQPILGLQYTKVTDENGTSDNILSEAGLGVSASGIPVVPGNTGFYISPRIGKAWGSIDSKRSGLETESVKYSRTFGGADFILYAGFYRHTLGINRGSKEFTKDNYTKVQTFSVRNDFGFLVLPWISGHLTHDYLVVFSDKMSEELVNEQDYWLHSRMFASFLDMFVDLGPGFTLTEEYSTANGSHTKVADGRIDYFKALGGLHLFWKIGATAQAKYIVNSSDNDLGNYAQLTLPEEGLNQPRSGTMPEDSLVASFFFGARDIFAGFGLGWQYNLQVLNMSEKDDKKKETTRDHGLTFTFSTRL